MPSWFAIISIRYGVATDISRYAQWALPEITVLHYPSDDLIQRYAPLWTSSSALNTNINGIYCRSPTNKQPLVKWSIEVETKRQNKISNGTQSFLINFWLTSSPSEKKTVSANSCNAAQNWLAAIHEIAQYFIVFDNKTFANGDNNADDTESYSDKTYSLSISAPCDTHRQRTLSFFVCKTHAIIGYRA